jgi:sarcosine oxidase
MQPGTDYLQRQEEIAQQLDINVQKLSRDEARKLFPYIDYKDPDVAWFESEEAGYVNPRKLVLAEQTLARKRGCTIIDDVATQIRESDR